MSLRPKKEAKPKIETLLGFLQQKPENIADSEKIKVAGAELLCPGLKEHVAGELPLELKALFVAIKELSDQARTAALLSLHYAQIGDMKNGEAALAFASVADKRHDAVNNVFFVSVRDYFDLWDKATIYLRFGYTVTWSDEEDVSDGIPVQAIILGKGLTADN